jgi:hypothetical protein
MLGNCFKTFSLCSSCTNIQIVVASAFKRLEHVFQLHFRAFLIILSLKLAACASPAAEKTINALPKVGVVLQMTMDLSKHHSRVAMPMSLLGNL